MCELARREFVGVARVGSLEQGCVGGMCERDCWSYTVLEEWRMSCRFQDNGPFQRRQPRHGLRKGLRPALCVLALWALVGSASALEHMTLQYTWGTFSFAFESEQQRQEISSLPDYAPQNSTPLDVDFDRATGRCFLSFPAVLSGGPVALATVNDTEQRDSPELTPYPDWSWHAGQMGCDGITSVFRIYIDKCRRLWVIDGGIVNIGSNPQHRCPPQLLVFDLRTDELIVRHRFNVPAEYNATTSLVNVIAEQMGDFCSDDAFAYIADTGAFSMYVFSLRSQRSWRIESDTFLPDPNAESFVVNGSVMRLRDGVMGLALNDRDEFLYYQALSSFQAAKVRKAVLRNEALFVNGTNLAADEFRYIGSHEAQSAAEALAKNSVLFFPQMTTESIYCWNTRTEYTSDNHHVVEYDSTLLRFVTGIKAISQGSPEEIWAIDNNGQRAFTGAFQPDLPYTVNIVRGLVSDLSSKCKRRWS